MKKVSLLFRLAGLLTLILMAAAYAFPAEAAHVASVLHLAGPDLSMHVASCVAVGNITSQDCGANPGGTVNLWVARRRDVATIPPPGADGVTIAQPITMKTGKAFAKWEFTQDTGELTHKSVGDAGNKSVTKEVTTYVPRGNAQVDAEINKAINGDFIIIVEDGLGQKRIGGNLLRGMIFDHDYKSGKKGTDKNGTDFKFLGEGFSHVPYYYDAAIPVTAGV